jgi:hypothetical protein
MEKIDLMKLIDDSLIPLGFKKKGNYWVLNSKKIVKIVELQRSQFSEAFYLNFGFNIPSLPFTTKWHIHFGIRTFDDDTKKDWLDLTNSIPNEKRKAEITKILTEKLVPRLERVSTEEDLLWELKALPNLNSVPLNIKEYFNLDHD